MIINDLNYLEIAATEADICGGRRTRRQPTAFATADAQADAIGYKTISDAYAETQAVAGLFSSSYASSTSYAKGFAVV